MKPYAALCLCALLTACQGDVTPPAAKPVAPATPPTVNPVTPPPPAPPPPAQDVALEFSGTPLTVALGESLRLSWTATHARTCTASGGWAGVKAAAGDETVAPAAVGITRYELTCSGEAAPATRSVNVTALDPFTEANAEVLRLRALEAELERENTP